jgi:hypothetical protein
MQGPKDIGLRGMGSELNNQQNVGLGCASGCGLTLLLCFLVVIGVALSGNHGNKETTSTPTTVAQSSPTLTRTAEEHHGVDFS